MSKFLNPVPNLVLMYHRVADVTIDPWNLSVDPGRFDSQLSYLREKLEPVPLSEIQKPSFSGRPKVAITFDDGYHDNFECAFPLLKKHGIPATFFVVGGTIGHHREFWWDELEQLILSTHDLPQRIFLKSSGGNFACQLGSATHYSKAQQQIDGEIQVSDAPKGTRLHLFHELWEFLCGLTHDERERQLVALWSWSGRKRLDRNSYRPMNPSEIRALDQSPLMDIGAHTMTHPRLPSLASDDKKEEILEGARQIRSLTGEMPTAFSYPFGQWDTESLEIVKNFFDHAVVTRPKCVTSDTPRHRLNRFAVQNWSMNDFDFRIQSWCHQKT